jgi:3',5'-cyclic AMP phosphodiesterase CpdA
LWPRSSIALRSSLAGVLLLGTAAPSCNRPQPEGESERRTLPASTVTAAAVASQSAVPPLVTARENQGVSLLERAFRPRSYSFVLLPDTQGYSLAHPEIFTAQTRYIASRARALDVRFVFHLGDIVDNNTDREWERARDALMLLSGIPLALVPGNHDYGPNGNASTRDTPLNRYFDFERVRASPSFGGAFEQGKLDNVYQLFSAGGRDYVVLGLEWGPRNAVLEWANGVMKRHPDRLGILVTHAYLTDDDRRADHRKPRVRFHNPHDYRTPPPVNDGEEIWQKLVSAHRFAFVFSGHELGDGAGYRADRTMRGTLCHQLLANYQMRERGGEGYLRWLEFYEDGRRVRVHAYSPFYDRMLEAKDHSFTLELDRAG